MKRVGDPEPDSYDGLYDIETELFKKQLAGLVVDEETADFNVQIRIKYGKFNVCLPDFCEYEQSGDEFSLKLPSFGDSSLTDGLTDSTFVLDGDHVTFYNSEGITEQFDKRG